MSFDSFIGIPYADKGRDRSGCDCWGLLRLVFAELRGVELPSYADRYVSAADRAALDALIAGELEPWACIHAGAEVPLDAVLMREGRFARHVGVVTRPGFLLHVSEGTSSRIERYRADALRHRVVGFYRFGSTA